MTDEAKAITPKPPYKVDFLNGEACTSDTWTNPRYREMGLATYADFKMTDFVKERGRVVHRAAILRDNVVSQRAYSKFGPTIYAEARYLRILWWKSWKEKPLADSRKHL